MSNGVSIDVSGIISAINSLHGQLTAINGQLVVINKQLADINKKQDWITNELNKLKQIEVAKAEAKLNTKSGLDNFIQSEIHEISSEQKEKKERTDKRYDDSIKELVTDFVDLTKVDRTALDKLKKEFDEFTNLKNAMLSDVGDLSFAHISNYGLRRMRITPKKQNLLGNLNKFLELRRQTIDKINSLQTQAIQLDEPKILYVPFWIIGVDDGYTEEHFVYPILKKTGSQTTTSRNEPYGEHLEPYTDYDFSIFRNEILERETIEKAKQNSILFEKQNLMPKIKEICHEYANPDGSNIFLEALEKFLPNVSELKEININTTNDFFEEEKRQQPAQRAIIQCPKCEQSIEITSSEKEQMITCQNCRHMFFAKRG